MNKLVHITVMILVPVVLFLIYTTYNQKYVAASDWYGYYEGSQLLKHGQVSMELELNPNRFPSIAPLSYFSWRGKIVPQYPPGYPLLMAIAGLAGLEYYVTPFLGVLSVIILFLLLKTFTEQWIAFLLAILWGLSPIVVFGSTSVMSDLVAAFFILFSLYLYRKGKIIPSAIILGYSLIVRPTDILFCLVFLPVLIRDRQWFKFGCYFAIPLALYGAYNWLVYGAPWQTGYFDATQSITTSVFFHHFWIYIRETCIQFTPFLIIPALYALRRLNKERLFYASWFLVFFLFYCFWNPGGECWWWTRFLLPGYPALFILAALGLDDFRKGIARPEKFKWKYSAQTVVVSIVLISFAMMGYFVYYGFNHPCIWEKDKGKFYFDTIQTIAEQVPKCSYIGSVEFGGAIRLYSQLKSFFITHWNTKYLIRNRLALKIPVYLVIEPWNRENPSIKALFELFHIKQVMQLEGWSNFYLYRVKRRNVKAWRAMKSH